MGGVTFSKPRRLEADDPIDGFSCGIPKVDEWLAKRARKARQAGTAVVYGSYADDKLAGFYALSTQSIQRGSVKGWLARNAPEQIPVVLLGMLGVDKSFQGMGLGSDLLTDAARRACSVAQIAGARALVVDPYDEVARAFYERWGFKSIPSSERMYAKIA